MLSDPILFQNLEHEPQFPAKCIVPNVSATSEKRQLLGGGVTKEQAIEACSHWEESLKANCIADVMVTNDLDLAKVNYY